MTTFNLKNIDKSLIEAALAERFFESVVDANNLRYQNGNIKMTEALDFFMANFRNDLSFYKFYKQSGYSALVLYKNVSLVYEVDFCSGVAKELQAILPEAGEWANSAPMKFWRAFLYENFSGNPFDRRYRYPTYKGSAKAMCESVLDELSSDR